MPRTLAALLQAALMAGMTAIAPYAGGRCGVDASPMPGMEMGGPQSAATPTAAASGGPERGSGRMPASHPRHHGCCVCLGPCAGCALVPLPASAAVALPAPARLPAPGPAAAPRAASAARRLLPFANGPPSVLG